MAHDITVRADGTAEAAYAGQAAWHGLGTVLDHAMTSIEALREAHLDWEVVQGDMWATLPPAEDGTPVRIALPNYRANIRADNSELLGVVSKDYGLVQNHEAFDFLDDLATEEVLRYEAAFSLRGGKQVVIVARSGDTDKVSDHDVLKRYLLFSTGHDGSTGVRIMPTNVRVVCANTFRLALGQAGEGELLTIKHGRDVKANLNRAKNILAKSYEQFACFTTGAIKMANHKLSSDQFQEFLDYVTPQAVDPTDQQTKALSNMRHDISVNMLHHHNQIGGMDNSAWAAFNSVTQYVDHLPRREEKHEQRFNVTQFGPGHAMKVRAFDKATELATADH
jgi:phage/plasmid-like protein (TIGR03299 family)